MIPCLVSDTNLVNLPLAGCLNYKMAEVAVPLSLKESPIGSKQQKKSRELKVIGTGHVGKELKTIKIGDAIQAFVADNYPDLLERSHCLPDQLVHSGVDQPEERFVNHPWYFITNQQTPSNKDKRCLSLPVVVVNSKNQSLVESVPE